ACLMMCAPRFSSGSLSSNSLAMVTPSLQTIGRPHFFSMSTHFDFGPSVTRTASARARQPWRIFSRASDLTSSCLRATMISLPARSVALLSMRHPIVEVRARRWHAPLSTFAEEPQQVRDGDDADELSIAGDGQAADTASLHEVCGA